jgi:hypothetical protein
LGTSRPMMESETRQSTLAMTSETGTVEDGTSVKDTRRIDTVTILVGVGIAAFVVFAGIAWLAP